MLCRLRIVGHESQGFLKVGFGKLVLTTFQVGFSSIVHDLGLVMIGQLSIPYAISKTGEGHAEHAKGDDHEQDNEG